jgi:hypothetical protein
MMIPSRDIVPLKSGRHAGVQDAGALSGPILEKDSKHNDLLSVSLFQVKARKCKLYVQIDTVAVRIVLVQIYKELNRFMCPRKF